MSSKILGNGTTEYKDVAIQKRHFIAICAMIALYYVTLRLNLVHIPIERDEGIFGYMGKAILDGDLPYKDYFDTKPPLIFYIYAFMLLFVPQDHIGTHLFLHFYNFLTLCTIYYTAKILFNNTKAGLFSAFTFAAISASPAFQGFTLSAEALFLLPLSLSILFIVLYIHKNPDKRFLIISGLCGAAACWIKQTAFLGLLCWFIYLIYTQYNKQTKLNKENILAILKVPTLWLAGGLGLSLLICIYFAYHGILTGMYQWSFANNLSYTKEYTEQYNNIWLHLLKYVLTTHPTITLLSIFSILYASIQKIKPSNILTLTIFLLVSIFTTYLGKPTYHYFMVLALPLTLIGGFAFNLTSTLQPIKTKYILQTLLVLLVISDNIINKNYYFLASPTEIITSLMSAEPYAESIKIAKYIKENADENDKIFILGAETQILFLSGLKSANPYLHPEQLFKSYTKDHKKNQENAWTTFKQTEPKYLLVSDNLNSIRRDGKSDLILLNNILSLINKDYILDMVFTVNKAGIPFVISKKNENDFSIKNKYDILIFKRINTN